MTNFTLDRMSDGVQRLRASLRGNLIDPVTFAEDIRANLSVGGENSLDAVLTDFAARLGNHLSDDSIRADILHLAEFFRWQGAWRARSYNVNDEIIAPNGQYYVRLRAGTDTVAPTATNADWRQVVDGSLESDIIKFHAALIEDHKIFTEDWGSLPLGTRFNIGDVVKRFRQWFVCEEAHAKGGVGPDNDSTRWSPLTNFAGEYDRTAWYHQGIYVIYRGRMAYSLADIVPSDPLPDHPDNVKWYYPQSDIEGIFRPWRYVEPTGGLDNLEISSTDTTVSVEDVTPDADADLALVNSIRAAQAAGVDTEMHISGTVRYFLKQDAPLSNTSGAILRVSLHLGAEPRSDLNKYLTELSSNTLTLADFRNSNGTRDTYGTNPDIERDFSFRFTARDFENWDLQQHETLNFVLLGNSINGFASVRAELTDVEITYDRAPDDLEEFRQEIIDMIAAFAQHQETVVQELPDPESPTATEFAYLSRIWRPTQGFDGNQGVVEYSPGEYQHTSGTANRARVVFGDGEYSIGSDVHRIRGFIQRGDRLRVGSAHYLSNIGRALHNPVGGAVAGLFWTIDNTNIFTSSNSWVLWVKNSLASRKPPWNIPTNVEQGGFHVRLYHDNTHIDINFAHGGQFETVDGIEYQYYYAQDATGAAWINNLNVSDVAASTVEIEFRRATDSQLLWLGDSTEGWTWVDPDDNPTAISRIDRIERQSLERGPLLASISGPSSDGQLTNRDWTITANVSGIEKGGNGQHPTGNWTRYLFLDASEYSQSLSGKHGLEIVVRRGSDIVSSVFLPFTQFAAHFRDNYEIYVGRWESSGGTNKNLYASIGSAAGVHAGSLDLSLACSGANSGSTVEIYQIGDD